MTTITDTPDLTFFFTIHRALRASAAQLEATLQDPDVTRPARARALAEWFDGFAGELHHHHTVEDTIFFPALASRVPTYAELQPGLAADHAELDELVQEMGVALHAVAAGDTPADAEGARAAACAIAAELRGHLERHLAVEDAEILPMFARHFAADEYEQLHQASMKQLTAKEAAFTCPWLMSNLSEEERRAMVATAPLPMKLVWYATRRGYARRTALAFGAAA